MICDCNHNNDKSGGVKIKHPKGNVFRLGIPLSKRVITFTEGVKNETNGGFEVRSLLVLFSKTSKTYKYEAKLIDGFVVVEDKGKLPIGEYDITVLAEDLNGDPLRFKEKLVLGIVDTTAEADYSHLDEFDGFFMFPILTYGGGRPSLIVVTEDAVKINEGTGFYGEITEDAVKLYARFGQSSMEVTENAVKIQINN